MAKSERRTSPALAAVNMVARPISLGKRHFSRLWKFGAVNYASQADRTTAEVARAFVHDMKAFFAAGGTGVKADGIAAMQLHALKQHYSGKLRLTDVKQMFVQMRDHA